MHQGAFAEAEAMELNFVSEVEITAHYAETYQIYCRFLVCY